MERLGRLIALPLLILSLALQGFAPAQASAMARDSLGQPICTGDGVRSDAGPKKAPAHSGHEHDCCAAACAAAGTLAAPADLGAAVSPPSAVLSRIPIRAMVRGPRGPPPRIARARGPPILS